jgi:hypothetical protein
MNGEYLAHHFLQGQGSLLLGGKKRRGPEQGESEERDGQVSAKTAHNCPHFPCNRRIIGR